MNQESAGGQVLKLRGGLGVRLQRVQALVGPRPNPEGDGRDQDGHGGGHADHRHQQAALAEPPRAQPDHLPIGIEAAQGDDQADVEGNRQQHFKGDERLESGEGEDRGPFQQPVVCLGEKPG